MSDDDLLGQLLRGLDRAEPDAAPDVVQDVLGPRFAVTRVRILLANYQLTALRPLAEPDDRVVLTDGAAGRAFETQQSVIVDTDAGGAEAWLPISVRGDRLGVLHLELAEPMSEQDLSLLSDVAALLGYELSAARRHTDLLHRVARSQRLTLAAELQWQLLPARASRAAQYTIAGHLEPAYAVHADAFDWSENEGTLQLGICDATMHLRHTPLLTTLAVTALRNARRSGLAIAEQVALADQAVYAHHQGEHCVDTILLDIEMASGRARGVRAGSPRPILVRDGVARGVELSDQLPLGMFEGTDYVEQPFALATGDRLVLASDGVLAGLGAIGEPVTDRALRHLLEDSVGLHPEAVVRRIIDTLTEGDPPRDLEDDATVVCLDWEGPGSRQLSTRSLAQTHEDERRLLRAVDAAREAP